MRSNKLLVIALLVLSTFCSGYMAGQNKANLKYTKVQGNELSDIKSIPTVPPDLKGLQD
jgi:hypothetical protein